MSNSITKSGSSRKFRIVGLGEVLWDCYGQHRHLGGAPSNFAIHAGQLGDEGILAGAIGTDQDGREIRRALLEKGLVLTYLHDDPAHPTGRVIVKLGPGAVPRFRCNRNVAYDHIQYTASMKRLARSCDAVLYGTHAQRSPVTRETIFAFLNDARHAVRVCDVNIRGTPKYIKAMLHRSMHTATIVKMNDGEFKILASLLAWERKSKLYVIDRLLSEYELSLICISLGWGGCILGEAGGCQYIPGVKIKAVDTTGAGDAFIAALLHRYLRKKSLRDMGSFANLVGAFVSTHMGAVPVYTPADLTRFRNRHPDRRSFRKYREFA